MKLESCNGRGGRIGDLFFSPSSDSNALSEDRPRLSWEHRLLRPKPGAGFRSVRRLAAKQDRPRAEPKTRGVGWAFTGTHSRRTLPGRDFLGTRPLPARTFRRRGRPWRTPAWPSSAGAGRRSWRRGRRCGSGGGPSSLPAGTWRWPRGSWRARGGPRGSRPTPTALPARRLRARLPGSRPRPGPGSRWWSSLSGTW